jgi:hypothetical protein
LADQTVKADKKGSQRFAGAGGSGNEGIVSGGDFRPTEFLGIGGRAEAAVEPGLDDGVKARDRHGVLTIFDMRSPLMRGLALSMDHSTSHSHSFRP